MDDYFPSSWNLVKRSFPSLASYALGSVVSAYRAGKRQAAAVARDSNLPVTWKGEMPRMKQSYPKRYVTRRGYRRRGPRVYKSGIGRFYRRMVRTSGQGTLTTTTGFASTAFNISLNAVQTNDIVPAYRLYRIRKVVLHLSPRVDSANSGLVNNFSTFIAAACDPEGTVAPTSVQNITAYDSSRSKWVNSGEDFTYTFYPKAVNTVDNAGTSTAVGSYGLNPWLQLNSTGITIPHRQLLLLVQCGSSNTASYDFFYDVHFDVKSI